MNIKNGLLTLGLLMFFVGSSFAQSDTLAELYKSYIELYNNNQAMTKQLEELNASVLTVDKKVGEINELEGRVTNLKNDLNTNLERVNRLTQNDVFTKKTRLETQKAKIVKTASFVSYSINSFNAIDQAFAQTDYMTDISSLNNPNNEELGFSLSDEIERMLEDIIIKDNNAAGKYLYAKNSVINSIYNI